MAEGGHLTQSEFFDRLTTLFTARSTTSASSSTPHGSIFLTQKRLSYSPTSDSTNNTTSSSPPTDFADLHPSEALPVLIRATDGKGKAQRKEKTKLATVVRPEELDAFYERFAEVCKAGMAGLKKRDRKAAKGKKKKGKKGGAGAAADKR